MTRIVCVSSFQLMQYGVYSDYSLFGGRFFSILRLNIFSLPLRSKERFRELRRFSEKCILKESKASGSKATKLNYCQRVDVSLFCKVRLVAFCLIPSLFEQITKNSVFWFPFFFRDSSFETKGYRITKNETRKKTKFQNWKRFRKKIADKKIWIRLPIVS